MFDQLMAMATKYYAATFYLAGFIGMVAHYLKKWARSEYQGNLWAYLVADNPRASLAAVITYTGAAAAVVQTGTIDGMRLVTVVALGFTTGYMVDSSINSTRA